MRNKFLIFGIFLFYILIGFTSAYTISNYDYSAGAITSSSYYSTGLDYEDCSGGSDFLVQIEPLSCDPLIVTSDLLEEEPVTVYCKIVATQVNPFIDVDAISYMSITGDYSSDVRSVGYFPSESALGYWSDGSLDNLALNDLGYVAITLRQNPNESSMPEYVEGTLTARLRYDIENSFGIGNAQFYLPVLNDDDFEDSSAKYSFWDGRGYARALSVDKESATIALYTPSFQRMGSVQLEKGETSNEIYIPNLNPCLATLKVRLNDLEDPDTRVKLKVNSDYIEVASGESFLDGSCKVRNIEKDGINQEVKIYCKGDEKSETFTLRLTPKVSLKIGEEIKEYKVGDYLYSDNSNEKSVYVGYIGSKGDSTEEKDLFVVLSARPYSNDESLSSSEISSIASQMDLVFSEINSGASVLDFAGTSVNKILGATVTAGKWAVAGEEFALVEVGSSTDFRNNKVSIEGFSVAQDADLISVEDESYFLSPGSLGDYLDGYKIVDDSFSEVGLDLEYSEIETITASPKISLKNSNEEVVASFYGKDCESHDDCEEYELSGTGLNFEEGDYDGFFDNVVSGTLDVSGKTIVLRKLVSEGNSDSSKYYANAMEDFETLINSYSSQTTEVDSETYGERGLYEAISLAYKLGQMKTMTELCNEFEGSYSDSKKLENVKSICDNKYKISNSELATYETQINGNVKKIFFEGIYEPSYEEYGAEVVVKGSNGKTKTYELKKGNKVYLYGLSDDVEETETTNEYIELISVDEDSATIKVNALKESTTSKLFETNTKTLKIDEADNFGSKYVFTVTDTNIEQSAKVTIIPSFNYQDSESTFNFSIGIEKRTILLTDEMIDNRIQDLNNSMKTLSTIVDGLDTFNRALGGVCLVTGGYLTLKNLIENSDGSAIAREEVMSGEGGWTERCSKEVALGNYVSLEDCFYENADAIDAEVGKVQNVIEGQNSIIKSLQEATSNNGVVDKTAFTGEYADKVSNSLEEIGSSISRSDGEGEEISINDVQSLLASSEAINQGVFDSSDLKEIQFYAELYSDAASNSEEKKSYQDKLYSSLTDLISNAESFVKSSELKQESGLINSFIMNLDSTKKTTDITITEHETFGKSEYSGYSFTIGNSEIASSEYVAVVTGKSLGETYLVVYSGESKKEGVVKATYLISTSEKTLSIYEIKDKDGKVNSNPLNLYFEKINSEDLENKYLNAELIYYESGSYDEYPSLVPFDTDEGWYVGVKDSDSGIAAYDASGKVRIIWLCNVGRNGLEEFSIYSNDYGDDICQQYDLTHDVVTFSGLTLQKTNSLLRKAQNYVEKAQDAYRNGISKVTIDGVQYDVGEPASSSSEIQCENYMSPKDCKLLFNVCDPVVCPSSRCDFGGNYPVSDVVQTGVVGSVLLCAPNGKEGIFLPVCTTGVQAGLESWVNIEESYRDCLQEYLDKGEITGACDRIHSIYACEFFWKQAIPLAKIGVSKVTSAISGEGVRGGSEYLTFSSALENAQDSFDYFTAYYAAESYNAFKIRNAEEAGSLVCKASASIVYASGADLLDSLTTPRSPAQYTGSFTETTLTTTTNPPTSHYKVSYYIYAGEDTGATYQVYLRGSSSSYYQDSSSTYLVDSGYISAGNYIVETPDFSTASGYTQLCISVNGEVECGFDQSVSTSFAENYLTDLYLEEQSTTKVTTEDDCTSGTASFYSLINPNLQDIVGDLTDTDLYADGITRVCATENPGEETDANWNGEDARWRDVGYCGDTDLRCWIDTETVKDAIKTLNIEESALEDTAETYLESLVESGSYVDSQSYSAKVSEIKSESNFETKIEMIDKIINKVFYTNQKAELFLLRGQAYGVLALQNLISEKDIISAGEGEITGEGGEEVTEVSSGGKEELVKIAKSLDDSLYIKVSSLSSSEKNNIDKSETIWTWNGIPVIQDYDSHAGCNCFDSVIHVYKKAGLSFVGFRYCLEDGIVDVDEDGCEKNKDIKSSYLEKGDILSIRWGTDKSPTIHNIIFLGWIDEDAGTAKVFDWIGTADTSDYSDKSWKSYLRAFRVFEMTLKFDEKSEIGTVYAVGKPYISSTTTEEEPEETEVDIASQFADYSSPDFEFQDGNVWYRNIHYKFYNNQWYWLNYKDSFWYPVSESLDNKNVALERNENLIVSLRNKNYVDGLELIIKSIASVNDADLVTDNVRMDNYGVFEVDTSFNEVPYFFRYQSKIWEFNPLQNDVKYSGNYWFDVSKVSFNEASKQIVVSGEAKVLGAIPSESIRDLVLTLVGKDFYEGSPFIFDISEEGEEVLEIGSQEFDAWENANLAEIDLSGFSEKQLSILSDAPNCIYCETYPEECSSDLCAVIGKKLGDSCQYYSKGEEMSLEPIYNCRAGGEFTDTELKSIYEAVECSDCGDGTVNRCNEKECLAVGERIGKNCVHKGLWTCEDETPEIFCDSELDNVEYNYFVSFLNENGLKISDISCENVRIVNSHFTEFHFSGLGIKDVSELQNFEELYYLDLDNNEISDVSFLSNLEKLELLRLNNNKLSTLGSFHSPDSLLYLHLDNNNFDDLSDILTGLPLPEKIKILSIQNNCISLTTSEFREHLSSWADSYFYLGNPRDDC